MSHGLVIVLAVAAAIPLLLGVTGLPLPGPLVEIVAGVAIGPSVLGWVIPDRTIDVLAVLGLSFLLFLAGFEVNVRQFRGRVGRQVLTGLAASAMLAAAAGAVFAALSMRGAALVAIALLATSLGLIVPVLADSGALHRPAGMLAVAGASAGEVAAVVALSLGVGGSDMAPAGRLLLLGLLLVMLIVVAAVIVGAEHVARFAALVNRLADTTAQIRIRLTVLLVAGFALAAEVLGFEAILGAFLAGVLVRTIDPDPERSHPHYPVKLDAVGFGLLIPVFFIASGITLDVRGVVGNPAVLAVVPLLVAALLIVRGLPALVFRDQLSAKETVGVGLLQATSLPFLLTIGQIGVAMQLLDRSTAAALVAAGIVSVLVFPTAALRLLSPRTHHPLGSPDINPGVVHDER
ncbi:cation:proton antiporter [Mycolicibacterium moriokaense]|nr:cation:proton antiporter [Mycolicibacterium moriokaense]